MMRGRSRARRNRSSRQRRAQAARQERPHRNSNVTPKVDLRNMAPITDPVLQYRILHHGHNKVKRARKKELEEVTFLGEPADEIDTPTPEITVNIRTNAPATALTYPRACALASLNLLKATADAPGVHGREQELANIINFKTCVLAQRCCINGARYLGKFIAQEMPSHHPAHIESVGSHPRYNFRDGDLGEWLAAMVIMDYAKMRSCGEEQHVEPLGPDEALSDRRPLYPLYDFYRSEDVESKYRKITLDAITYMGWSDGRNPVTWSELIDSDCPNGVKLSREDRHRLEQVLKKVQNK